MAGWRVLERPNARGLVDYLLRLDRRRRTGSASAEPAIPAVEAIVLDWTLPGPSGLDALRAIKRHRALRHLRVIVLTAHSTSSLARQALAAGAERFLQKPLHPEKLLAALDQSSAVVARI
jgi:CheY-like chemotaxis protein